MALFKAIIEKHGGKIEVESKEGQEITFIFTLQISEKVEEKSYRIW
ncbi:MAG TPA: hypothetical protein QF836_05420 [Nitrospinota bacterium]|nr:hypothetical protein [Nitrospinota bacterium]